MSFSNGLFDKKQFVSIGGLMWLIGTDVTYGTFSDLWDLLWLIWDLLEVSAPGPLVYITQIKPYV